MVIELQNREISRGTTAGFVIHIFTYKIETLRQ